MARDGGSRDRGPAVNSSGGPEVTAQATTGVVVLVGAPSQGAAMGTPVVLGASETFTGTPELMTGYDACMRAVATDSSGLAYINAQSSPGSGFGNWTLLN